MGVKPLYYTVQQGRLFHASSVAELRRLPGLTLTPDPDWMARYLVDLSASNTRTCYREVFKAPPGHALHWDGHGQPVLRRYHHWRDDAPFTTRRDPRWVEAYRAVLEEAIRCRMDEGAPMGKENSGGIDSATVTAFLAHLLGEPGDRLHSFGFAIFEREPAMILATSQVRRIVHNHIITAKTLRESWDERIDRIQAILGHPEQHRIGSGHTPFYRECQQRGIRTLHSGFGGDEVVTNPGHHLRRELMDRRHYATLSQTFPGNHATRPLRLIKLALADRRREPLNPVMLRMRRNQWAHVVLRPEISRALGLGDEYAGSAHGGYAYRRTNDYILQGILPRPYIATRLEHCTIIAAAHGVDYRWPLWDVRLVQQYLSTPSIEKYGPGGMDLYLHRRAIDQVVPNCIAWTPRKSMGLRTMRSGPGDDLINRQKTWLRDLEANLHPDILPLIDREKLKSQISKAGVSDAAFQVVFTCGIHALHQLDRWLKHHSVG